MEAVHKGRMDLVRALCDAGVHPSEGNADDYSSEGDDIGDALLLAAKIGPERLQAFMHPFIYHKYHNSMMYAAARIGHESVMRQLLTSGRHYNALSMIKAAASNGHEGIVRLLLEANDHSVYSGKAFIIAATNCHESIVHSAMN